MRYRTCGELQLGAAVRRQEILRRLGIINNAINAATGGIDERIQGIGVRVRIGSPVDAVRMDVAEPSDFR